MEGKTLGQPETNESPKKTRWRKAFAAITAGVALYGALGMISANPEAKTWPVKPGDIPVWESFSEEQRVQAAGYQQMLDVVYGKGRIVLGPTSTSINSLKEKWGVYARDLNCNLVPFTNIIPDGWEFTPETMIKDINKGASEAGFILQNKK